MTEKRFKMVKSEFTGKYVPVDNNNFYNFCGFEDKWDCMNFVRALNDFSKRAITNGKIASKYLEENEKLKKALDDFKAYDDEDFRETEYINSIYKEDGFNGVIDYAKRRLCQYGFVKEVQDGLWVMVTGGWSDNEFWLNCLNSPVSIFHMKHYCAYETGGAFYYTEKPYDKIEIRLKGDVE